MKKLLISLFLLLGPVALAQATETSHVRILVHDHKEVARGFGTAGWLVMPDFTVSSRTMVVLGPRYAAKDSKGQNDCWWLEVLAGAVVWPGKADPQPLFDIRFSPPPLHRIVSHWLDVEWIDFTKGKEGKLYWYYQLDLALPLALGKIGLETENTHRPDKDSWSLGPHLVVPVGKNMKITAAYQWRRKFEGNQWWFRTLIDLR